VWREESAAIAMERSDALVAQYVAAGFRKIHLDCSMGCADDPSPLPEAVIASRAARLCAASERAWQQVGGNDAPVYVIGTEVPTPGGATEDLQTLEVTRPEAVAATIATHRDAFAEAGLGAAWSRVIALVVQPGVEFDHHKVVDYEVSRARALSAFIEKDPQFVYEAHSTDYQTPDRLRALVRDHFAILKVGPAATFALRETLWALDAIESELPGLSRRAALREVVLGVMRADPRHWRAHYHDRGNESLDLAYSLSDRIRYYWPHPDVQRACTMLLENLRSRALPMTLVSQYLPRQYEAIRAGRLDASADALLRDGIATALRPYVQACGS
jgi:D-tagatose-1,6-bisphosphate aldolase subunit GatZ/KbaZ